MNDTTTATQQRELFHALREESKDVLEIRSYAKKSLNEAMASSGVPAGDLTGLTDKPEGWIPGVEVFHRQVYKQRHRGHFGEFARRDEGVPGQIGMWPTQWAAATMFAGTAKGFHIHPPYIPDGEEVESWFQRLFVEEPNNYALRPYDKEQWDMMFFVTGSADMFLVDERAGMERKLMRFFIDSDESPGRNNVGVVIPPGVAHAIFCESSRDLLMVYGTSTSFKPEFEGRIASEVELCDLPGCWSKYLAG